MEENAITALPLAGDQAVGFGVWALIADADPMQRTSLSDALSGIRDLKLTVMQSGEQVASALASDRYDCIVLGEMLADMPAMMLLRRIVETGDGDGTPWVLYGVSEERCGAGETRLDAVAEVLALKKADSLSSVLSETTTRSRSSNR